MCTVTTRECNQTHTTTLPQPKDEPDIHHYHPRMSKLHTTLHTAPSTISTQAADVDQLKQTTPHPKEHHITYRITTTDKATYHPEVENVISII